MCYWLPCIGVTIGRQYRIKIRSHMAGILEDWRDGLLEDDRCLQKWIRRTSYLRQCDRQVQLYYLNWRFRN